ncbi:MAG: hypothetical protein C4339_04820 [Nitrososphaerota archaeon]
MVLSPLIKSLGYAGIFGSSFLVSLIPFVPVPYLLTLTFAVDTLGLNPLLSALLYSLGSSLGKLAIFSAGRGGRALLGAEAKSRLEPLAGLLNRHAWLPLMAEALLPLPDDTYLLPLGLAKFSFGRYLIAIPAGKFLRALVAFAAFSLLLRPLQHRFGGLGLELVLGATYALLTFAAMLVMAKVDWRRLLQAGNRINKGHEGLGREAKA